MPTGIGQGPTTVAGAAAETAYASTTSPSVLSQLQQQTDWLRTAQQLGTFGTSGAMQTGMAKYLIGTALTPGVQKSALAMAQLSPIAQEYGMAPVTPGESAKQMAAAFKAFLQGSAGGASAETAKQYAAALTTTTEKIGNLPQDYQAFVTTASGTAQPGLANAADMFGQQIQTNFQAAAAKGLPSGALTGQYANVLKAAGFSPGAAGDVAGYAAKVAGAPPTEIQKIIQEVQKASIPAPPKGGAVHWTSVTDPPKSQPGARKAGRSGIRRV